MLASKIINQTFFNFLQQFQKLFFSTIINIIVIQALPRDAYGAFGLAAGYFVFVSFLVITPEAILARDYRKLKSDKKNNELQIASIFSFCILRGVFIILSSFCIGLWLLYSYDSTPIFIIMVLYGAFQAALLMSGSLQFLLKMEFMQHVITKVTASIKIIQTICILLLFFSPTVYLYISILILTHIVEIIIWTTKLRKVLFFPLWQKISITYREIKKNVISYSLWEHFNRTCTKFLYEIDTFFLSLFATLITIGNYAIALKMANLSFIIPSIIQTSTMLSLTRIDNKEKQHQTVNIFLRYTIIIAIAQLVFFYLFGRWYIGLHTDQYVDEIFQYAMLIFIGTALLNASRPLLGYVFSKLDIRKFLFHGSLPIVIIASIVYPISAYLEGGVGIAAANIVCYSIWVLILFNFVRRNDAFRLHLLQIPREERERFALIVSWITTRLKRFIG